MASLLDIKPRENKICYLGVYQLMNKYLGLPFLDPIHVFKTRSTERQTSVAGHGCRNAV